MLFRSLFVLGSRVALDVSTPMSTNRELDTIVFELTTEGNRVHRGGVHVQEVYLFEGQSLGLKQGVSFAITWNGRKGSETNLGDAEVGEQEASCAGGSPNEEDLHLKTGRAGLLVDQVWSGVTDTKVPEPVGGDGERHGLGTDVEREDFTGNDPGDRSPRRGKEGDVDANEGNQNLLPGGVLGRDRDTDDSDQELADAHADRTDQKQPPTTEPLDTPHPGKSHEHVDDVGGDGDQEGVRNTRVLEEHGAVVENEVDAGELLPGLNKDTSEGTEKNFVVGGTEAVCVRRLAQLLLVLVGNADLVEFGLEFGVIGREGNEAGESAGSILVALLLDEPSR